MKNLQDITVNITPILEKAGVSRCFVFGSYAKGEETVKSDIDLLVEFGHDDVPSLFTFIGIKNDLEEKLNIPVDLVTPDALNKYMKEEILSSAKKIYVK